jgi:hypothetical protein
MTRKESKPLFPTLTSSNKLLIYFQFIARAFVTSLTGYVFDTAIRGNFDTFLAKLSPGSHSSADEASFSDVFALAHAHSAVLDDILFACLLRSGQRAVGDLLRGALAVILDFGILAGELKTGRLEEYHAAPLLEDYFRDFRGKMTTLVRFRLLLHSSILANAVTSPFRPRFSECWRRKVLCRQICRFRTRYQEAKGSLVSLPEGQECCSNSW